MTEAEWLASTDPEPMLEFIRGKTSARKLRLFGCSCCRRKWKYLTDKRCQQAVEIAERFADDSDTIGDLDRASRQALLAFNEWRSKQGGPSPLVHACLAVRALTETRLHVVRVSSQVLSIPHNSVRARGAEAQSQVNLVYDIFGNPFCQVTAEPLWLSSTVVALASGIYSDRAFDRMPILADALMEAGCENADILDHCRSESVHIRGCWVVDLILGKE